jgi:predicted O-methyltransferase YrrM
MISIQEKNRKNNVLNNDNLLYKTISKKFMIFLCIIIVFNFTSYCYYLHHKLNLYKKNISPSNESNIDINFDFANYERNIITKKVIDKAGWQMSLKTAYFLNGIIRKFKPKKCLEIGVANGGSSILILNAIKDIDNSFLVSLDLNTQMYLKSGLKTGYRVKKYFPELSQKWRLFTGDLPHKFLTQLNETFDFFFLDSAHLAPGELLNFIEALPFLKEKAIMILHDILWHFWSSIKIYPSNVYLFPNIRGEKILLSNNKRGFGNIGGIILYPNQNKYYLDYFLLLLGFWEYLPPDSQINDMKKFIQKYYKNSLYLQIFQKAINLNNKSIQTQLNSTYDIINSRYKRFMKSLGGNIKNIEKKASL